jgi:hypothetical protein
LFDRNTPIWPHGSRKMIETQWRSLGVDFAAAPARQAVASPLMSASRQTNARRLQSKGRVNS